MNKSPIGAALGAFALFASLLVSAAPSQAAPVMPAAAPGDRPNILLITTDDQSDIDLQYMPKTMRLLAGSGINFTDGITPHSLCCPGRGMIFTGKYAQNNGVKHNDGPFGGYDQFLANGNRNQQIGRWMSDAGYRTGFVGKMMNGYQATTPRPTGWDRWSATLAGTYSYYNTQFEEGKSLVRYTDEYVADVVGAKTNAMIRDWSNRSKPFLIWASHVGPHTSKQAKGNPQRPIPANRHAGDFAGIEVPTKSKPSFRATGEPGSIDRLYQARVESLQAIDEANASSIRLLKRKGEWNNTVVIFISDNGWQYGEHGLVGKNYPFQENLQVPFLMHAPDAPEGVRIDATPSLVDIAPTFLDYAGVLPQVRNSGQLDGESIRTYFDGGGNDTTLIQAGSEFIEWKFRGVRTPRYTYVEYPEGESQVAREVYDAGSDMADPFVGEYRLYDRRTDPFEMENLVNPSTGEARDPSYTPVVAELKRRYTMLRNCKGVVLCERQQFGPEPVPAA